MPRELIFSVTKKDFRIDTFRAGGKGGQNQNKRETGVRIVHPESGAVGESRTERHQAQNKKLAFNRLVKTDKFQNWLRVETAHRLGVLARIEESVEEAMNATNIKIERRVNGKWEEWNEH